MEFYVLDTFVNLDGVMELSIYRGKKVSNMHGLIKLSECTVFGFSVMNNLIIFVFILIWFSFISLLVEYEGFSR